jgi:glyoxylase I family protein
MVTFAGVDHVALTVTDLDVSQQFYTQLLDFVLVMDVGYGRILMHPQSGFTLGLLTHDQAQGGHFTELATGLDHLGFVAESREELEEWERRFDEQGVTYTPIRDMEFGYHLNFRDPDGIALEFMASNELMLAAQQALAAGHTSPEAIAAFLDENLSAEGT